MTATDDKAFSDNRDYIDMIRHLTSTFENAIVRDWVHRDSTNEDVLTMHFVVSTTVNVPSEMNVGDATEKIESATAERLRREVLKKTLDRPIIRCRECRFFKPGTDETHYGFYWCEHWRLWLGLNIDGYCAWGDRG